MEQSRGMQDAEWAADLKALSDKIAREKNLKVEQRRVLFGEMDALDAAHRDKVDREEIDEQYLLLYDEMKEGGRLAPFLGY